MKKEKLTHLHFYFHDILSGRNPTVVRVAESPLTNRSLTEFDIVNMADDLLTVGPERGSKAVGRAQGIYASADMNEVGLLMVMNFAFKEGKYNGSTLSLLGRNAVLSGGVFRLARGYAEARTHQFDYRTGDAVVEYN
ncbi:hypothetical protein Ancab_030901, partial [Ancistrocladus abbreviatus]